MHLKKPFPILVCLCIIFLACLAYGLYVARDAFKPLIDQWRGRRGDQVPKSKLSIQSLKNATNNFSPHNKLGEGGAGEVYRADLKDGSKAAVKRMKTSEMSMKQFQAEVEVLECVRHRNLVGFLGACNYGKEKLLAYEYMPGGTLEQCLHKWKKGNFTPLTWKERIDIALDTCRGVEYIHEFAGCSYIHRDLKTANILLDENLRAKVGDFGLAKNATDGHSLTTNTIVGTVGYLAPEYYEKAQITKKLDIFAIGVILMELIAGKRAIENNLSGENVHLRTRFLEVLTKNKNDIPKLVDEALHLSDDEYICILEVAELAAHCTNCDPDQRPHIGHVVSTLNNLVVEKWRPAPASLEIGLPEIVVEDEGQQTVYFNSLSEIVEEDEDRPTMFFNQPSP